MDLLVDVGLDCPDFEVERRGVKCEGDEHGPGDDKALCREREPRNEWEREKSRAGDEDELKRTRRASKGRGLPSDLGYGHSSGSLRDKVREKEG